MGLNHDLQGNYAAARSEFEQSLRVCRELGDAPETAGALSNLAGVVRELGEHMQARSLLEEAMSILHKLDDWIGVAWSLNHLGDVARDRGDFGKPADSTRKVPTVFAGWGSDGAWPDPPRT